MRELAAEMAGRRSQEGSLDGKDTPPSVRLSRDLGCEAGDEIGGESAESAQTSSKSGEPKPTGSPLRTRGSLKPRTRPAPLPPSAGAPPPSSLTQSTTAAEEGVGKKGKRPPPPVASKPVATTPPSERREVGGGEGGERGVVRPEMTRSMEGSITAALKEQAGNRHGR